MVSYGKRIIVSLPVLYALGPVKKYLGPLASHLQAIFERASIENTSP